MDGYHVLLRDVAIAASLLALVAGAIARQHVVAVMVGVVLVTFLVTSLYLLCFHPPGLTMSMSIAAFTTAIVIPVILCGAMLGRVLREPIKRKT